MKTFCYFRYVLIVFFFILNGRLLAEIEYVVVTWNPGLCQASCIKGLEERFKKVPGVDAVEMNGPNGFARLTWKKRVPFSFQPINYALRWIGIREKDVRVKVRGYIAIYKDMYSIISSEDHTHFVLFNRVTSSPNDYVIEFNPANRILTPELKEQFDEIKRNNQTVVIEGSLFMPQRSPPDPLRLIIGVVQVEEKRTDQKTSVSP